VRAAVPLLREGGDFPAVSQHSSTVGIDAAGTTIGSTDRRRANKQRNCQSFLLVRANREESPVQDEAQSRSRRPPGHRAGVPEARIYGVDDDNR